MIRILSIAIALLLLSGCGYKEGVATGDAKAYLFFTGVTEGAQVSIDGGDPFTVEAGRDHQYRILPGKHRISVTREGRLLVDREIYVGDGVAKEIGIGR